MLYIVHPKSRHKTSRIFGDYSKRAMVVDYYFFILFSHAKYRYCENHEYKTSTFLLYKNQ